MNPSVIDNGNDSKDLATIALLQYCQINKHVNHKELQKGDNL